MGLELRIELGSGSLIRLEDGDLIFGLARQGRTRQKTGRDSGIDIGSVSVAEYIFSPGLKCIADHVGACGLTVGSGYCDDEFGLSDP